MRKHNKPIVKP